MNVFARNGVARGDDRLIAVKSSIAASPLDPRTTMPVSGFVIHLLSAAFNRTVSAVAIVKRREWEKNAGKIQGVILRSWQIFRSLFWAPG